MKNQKIEPGNNIITGYQKLSKKEQRIFCKTLKESELNYRVVDEENMKLLFESIALEEAKKMQVEKPSIDNYLPKNRKISEIYESIKKLCYDMRESYQVIQKGKKLSMDNPEAYLWFKEGFIRNHIQISDKTPTFSKRDLEYYSALSSFNYLVEYLNIRVHVPIFYEKTAVKIQKIKLQKEQDPSEVIFETNMGKTDALKLINDFVELELLDTGSASKNARFQTCPTINPLLLIEFTETASRKSIENIKNDRDKKLEKMNSNNDTFANDENKLENLYNFVFNLRGYKEIKKTK